MDRVTLTKPGIRGYYGEVLTSNGQNSSEKCNLCQIST